MNELPSACVRVLRKLRLQPDAKRRVSIIPLGSIYWDDEVPESRHIGQLTHEEQTAIWTVFALRFKFWDGEQLTPEESAFWESARTQVPDWPLFSRLVLSPDDRQARLEAEDMVQEELQSMFGAFGEVEVRENGLFVEWSITRDPTEDPDGDAA
jgi:hypothetical protein